MKQRIKYTGNLVKSKLIQEFTIKQYGYHLTQDMYQRLSNSNFRSKHFDKLLCDYTKHHFHSQKSTNLNLHRWSLDNRDKNKYEIEYPW